VKVAVIGAGDMGSVHAKGWTSFGMEVAAISDVDMERCSRLSAEVGATPYASYQEALSRTDIDIVSVCIPVSLHADVSCFALEHGMHVLCEKPIALTLKEADRMIAAAEASHRFLSVSYQYRCFEYFAEIRRRFRQGDFGEHIFAHFADVREVRPKTAMHRKSMNGGPIIDAAGHFFDIMRFITGAEPVLVSARGQTFGAGKARLRGIDDLAIDAADIQVTMSGGHLLHAFMNWGMPEGFKGYMEFSITGPELQLTMRDGVVEAHYRGRNERWSDFASTFHSATSFRIDDMIRAATKGEPPEVSGLEGRRALAVSLAALESIDRGTEISLPGR